MIDNKILDAAQRVIASAGLESATLENIAQAAGISRSTLHRHKINKESIIIALTNRATENYRAAMWPALTAAGSARDRLLTALDILCEQAEVNMALLLGLEQNLAPIFHEEGEEATTRTVFTEPLERLLRDGIADGSLRPLDPTETATVLFNLVGWTFIHLRSGHSWSKERAKKAVIDIAVQGVVLS